MSWQQQNEINENENSQEVMESTEDSNNVMDTDVQMSGMNSRLQSPEMSREPCIHCLSQAQTIQELEKEIDELKEEIVELQQRLKQALHEVKDKEVSTVSSAPPRKRKRVMNHQWSRFFGNSQ